MTRNELILALIAGQIFRGPWWSLNDEEYSPIGVLFVHDARAEWVATLQPEKP